MDLSIPTPKLIPELCCSDYNKSLSFYTDVLGFNIDYKREEEGFAMLEKEGAFLMIDLLHAGSTWTTGAMEKPFGRGINLQIEVEDVDALYENVKKHNHPIFIEMEEKWYRADNIYVGNRQFLVQDPDGYLLRFFENLGSREKI
ncbi:MAG: VOC family protein [Rhodospirillales bacterium]|nr:VOC family protein [Rhodospirillales bacterium]MCB9964984.1 VOC family protein [Rhodospirillales bacterium]MCB9973424.1 VOC family protein [Rhodospirillales bacterium]MCB9980427.1 VOC family protein [Rhodospirillales bacterium]